MRSIIILFVFAHIGIASYGADTLSTDITKATVFLSGAQVFRQSRSVSIKKGVNEVIIKDVSPYLNQQQIQATAIGAFLILDVQYQTEYIAPVSAPPAIMPEKIQKEINWLNDSLLFVGFEKERIQEKLNNLSEEKRMVTQNQLIKSGGISDTLPEFKEIVEFYRIKLDEINELIHEWKKKQYYVSAREQKFRNRLNELNSYASNVGQPVQPAKTRYHILVTTYTDVATTGKIEVNYLVPNAGWIPAYDLRANNTNEPMTVTYKARVFQNSGENWDNVDLVLSTFNQNTYATKPTIGVWRLDYVVNKSGIPGNEVYYSQNFSSEVELASFEQNQKKDMNKEDLQVLERKFIPLQSLSDVNQNLSAIEFDVKLPYSVRSDGSQKLMVIAHEEVEANFFHYLLPRMNKNGFLIARIGDWEELNLLPGKANIYFNQTIVGSTMINPSQMSDTLELTLGKDDGIIATRKKISEEVNKVRLSNRTQKEFTFEIEVRNNTRGDVNITMEDIIPVTTNEEIQIKLIDADGAEINEETGKLTWRLKMKAGERTKLKFSYSVEYDKDKPIS